MLKDELMDILNKNRIDNLVSCLVVSKKEKYIKLLANIKEETTFLNEFDVTISERIYCIINDIINIQICDNENCKNKLIFKRYGLGYAKHCSNKCRSTSEKNKKLHIDTIREKYGVDNIFNVDEFKEKSKVSCLIKYGTEYAIQSKEIKEKVANTCMKKYGAKNCFQSKEKIQKIKETNLERYGVVSFKQSDFSKNGYKWYKYKLPSGKEVNIQGYENMFLDEYFTSGGLEDNILIENKDISCKIGKILYYTDDDNIHRYFPDFYLIQENKIIEVKSTYTIKCNLDNNQLKKTACLNMGLNFEYKVYNK